MPDRKPKLTLRTNVSYDLIVADQFFSGTHDQYGPWYGWPFTVPQQTVAITGKDNTSFPPGTEGVYFATPAVHEKLIRGGARKDSRIRLWKEEQGDATPIRVWVEQQEVVGEAPAENPPPPDTAPTDPSQFGPPPAQPNPAHADVGEAGPPIGQRQPLEDGKAAVMFATMKMAELIAKTFDDDRESRTTIFLGLKDIGYHPTPKMIDVAAKEIVDLEKKIEAIDPSYLPF